MVDSIEELNNELSYLQNELQKLQSLKDIKVQIDDFDKMRDRILEALDKVTKELHQKL